MGGAEHILVVEDDTGIRDTIAELLQIEGYRVTVARDGLEGLARLAERRPDAAVIDLFMPGLGGMGMVERLRADPATRDLPVLLLTGLAPRRIPVPGVDALLEKPFEIEELVRVLARLLGRSAAAQPPTVCSQTVPLASGSHRA